MSSDTKWKKKGKYRKSERENWPAAGNGNITANVTRGREKQWRSGTGFRRNENRNRYTHAQTHTKTILQ